MDVKRVYLRIFLTLRCNFSYRDAIISLYYPNSVTKTQVRSDSRACTNACLRSDVLGCFTFRVTQKVECGKRKVVRVTVHLQANTHSLSQFVFVFFSIQSTFKNGYISSTLPTIYLSNCICIKHVSDPDRNCVIPSSKVHNTMARTGNLNNAFLGTGKSRVCAHSQCLWQFSGCYQTWAQFPSGWKT